MKRFLGVRQEEKDIWIEATFVFILGIYNAINGVHIDDSPIYFEKTASLGVLQPPNTVQNLVHYIV